MLKIWMESATVRVKFERIIQTSKQEFNIDAKFGLSVSFST